jgi:hypothetical protein
MENLKTLSDTQLAVNIYGLGEFAYKLGHDAHMGRIEPGVAEDPQLTKNYEDLVAELKSRTGLTKQEEIRQYIRNKVGELEQDLDKRCNLLWREGAVFKFKEYNLLWETVGAYLPPDGMFGPKKLIFARARGTGNFRFWDDRHVLEFTQVQEPPMYGRDIIRYTGDGKERLEGLSTERTPFRHADYQDIFETVRSLKLKNGTPIILGRSRMSPVFLECGGADHSKITPMAHDSLLFMRDIPDALAKTYRDYDIALKDVNLLSFK